MDPISMIVLELAKGLGVPPVTAALIIPVTVIVANRVARVIPDTATGVLKYVRLACVLIGLHIKDNSGVPAIKTGAGVAVRQAAADAIPEPVEDFLAERGQGVLELTDEDRFDPIGRGARVIREREQG